MMERFEMYKVVTLRTRGNPTVKDVLKGYNGHKMNGIALVDVDGCIRNGYHRLNLLPSQEEITAAGDTPNIAFNSFNEACHLDTPILPVISLVNILSDSDYYIIILTSCTHSEHTLSVLIEQLDEWGIPNDVIVMRGKDNHRWPVEFKRQFIYDSGIDTLTSSKYALDDCNGNCNMFRENGFTALQTDDYTRFNKGDTK